MLIDPIAIHYSGAVAHTIVESPDQAKFINRFKRLLVSVGWTLISSIPATATVGFPLGTPITDGVSVFPLTPIGPNAFPGFLSVGDVWFTAYDPFKQTPVPGLDGGLFFELDTTFAGTLTNLVNAITSGTTFNASLITISSVSYQILLEAKVGGPDFNFVMMQSAFGGFLAGPARSSGGGYELESSGDEGAAVYRVTAKNADPNGAGVNYLGGNLLFDFNLNGSHFGAQILDATQGTLGFMGELGVGAVAQYTLIANGHGFAIFDEPHDTTTHQFRSISLFAMAPYFPGSEVPPTEHFTSAYAVFVVSPNQIGGSPSWNNQYMASTVMCLDGAPFTRSGWNASARLLAYRSPSTDGLLTPSDVPITIGCYVMFGNTITSDGWIVGKLFDCALVSDYVATGAIIDDRKFLAIGSVSDAAMTKCTFLMACGEEFADVPPVPLPPPPPPTPSPAKAGTVNLFGDGVTWVSGDVFTSDMEGHSITIGGDSYIVLTFIDSTHLTLDKAKTIASGTAYTTP